MTAPGRKRKTYDVVIDMTPTTFTSAKSTVAMCAGEAGVVVAHGQACWEAPSSSSNWALSTEHWVLGTGRWRIIFRRKNYHHCT